MMAINDEAQVPAAPLIVARNQLTEENSRVGNYQGAREFWASYEKVLTARRDLYQQHRTDLQNNTKWETPAAQEFYARVDAGLRSIDAWLAANLPDIAEKFRVAADTIGRNFQRVNEIHDALSGKRSVLTQSLPSGRGEIPTFRMEGTTVFVSPAGLQGWVEKQVEDAKIAADEVIGKFTDVTNAMRRLPNQKWEGPGQATKPATGPTNPRKGTGPGGPGGAPIGPGGSGMKESTQDPGATQPGGKQPGGEQPGGEQPGGEQPGADVPTGSPGTDQFTAPDPGVDPGLDPSVDDPFLPPPDPSLAGTPSATLTPPAPSLSPLSPGSSLPSPLTAGSPSTHPAASPFPLTPMGSLPTQTGSPARRGGSEVDGQPVRPGSGESSSRAGSGFYPGAIPPMYPPMGGGAGSGGVGSGEAPYGRGHNRRASARESQRAGLRPGLLGRAGTRADEEVEPLQPVSGDEVLDEELWQVPGAAPATPPEPEGRRRQW